MKCRALKKTANCWAFCLIRKSRALYFSQSFVPPPGVGPESSAGAMVPPGRCLTFQPGRMPAGGGVQKIQLGRGPAGGGVRIISWGLRPAGAYPGPRNSLVFGAQLNSISKKGLSQRGETCNSLSYIFNHLGKAENPP